MKTFKLVNNILGWIVFAIAAVTYLVTIEPTASFWDCGEFISSAYKLEVGHPPGNPIFMMAANLFTQLTSDTSLKAMMVNSMSAIFSALTILFLFWTITHLARKIFVRDGRTPMTVSKMIAILGCGVVGALAYTWSDTFWFSAVEGEVYAFSSLMTGLVFWVILKWEDVAGEPHSDRWLILIAYLMGISIAVHLLNLLCIPAIVLVYYYKKYPNPNLKGSLIALLISFVIVGVMLYGIIQGLMKVAGWFELLFVNGLGLPYNTGTGFYIFLVFAALGWGIWETMSEKFNPVRAKIAFLFSIALLGIPFFGNNPWIGIVILVILGVFFFSSKKLNPAALNTILISLFVITIGYSSYALIMIRSAANTPMDQNSPEDVFTLREYLSREQYGETPLLYGQTFVAESKKTRDGNLLIPATKDNGPVWRQIAKSDSTEKDHYFVSRRSESLLYPDELCTIFPRMYSKDHAEAYKGWVDFKGKRVRFKEMDGGPSSVVIAPTFLENLHFFFSYQVNFMYWRYFMWNFAGRQNEIQGNGEVANGNWITGIKFLDEMRVGPQDNLPDFIAENKGHNKFYLLPLLLGILGIFFQIYSGKKGTQDFWVVFFLFFMTGLAIVLYLNQTPNQPRERDYAYAGSFYAFCIWIGLGVGLIEKLLRRIKIPALPAAIIASVLCVLVPIQMVSQTWDDHDRSKRYLSRDFGFNYLSTCEPNAVIFTMGDNDTFPLWYAQEVEGYRTDVRVCNLSYLQTDWYIDQMKRQAYESAPLPISWKRTEYIQGKHDVAYILDPGDNPQDVAYALARVKSDDNRVKRVGDYPPIDNIRTNILYIPVDTAAAVKSGTVKPEDAGWMTDKMYIYLGPKYNTNQEIVQPEKKALFKQEMMILDMLRNNQDWSRPFYFATTVGPDQYVRLDNYFRQDGVAYRVVPYDITQDGRNIDTDILYENLMHKYRWGNMEEPGLFIDSNSGRMARVFRSMFGTLGTRLAAEGKKEKAIEAMDYGLKSIPDYNVPYDFYSMNQIANGYIMAGDTVKATQINDKLVESISKELDWYTRLSDDKYISMYREVNNDLYLMGYFLQFYEVINPKKYESLLADYNRYYQRLEKISKKMNRGGANR
ncbi:membrane protein [Bacteroidia bacterium]|nr:membrane protein [Bacteroidia bacterium]